MLKRPDAAPQRRWNLTQRISNLRWLPVRHWFDLRDAMRLRVTVRDKADGHRYRFVADSLPAYQRSRHLLHKEPTTIRWLRANLRPTDVFLDIGANVGTCPSSGALRQVDALVTGGSGSVAVSA